MLHIHHSCFVTVFILSSDLVLVKDIAEFKSRPKKWNNECEPCVCVSTSIWWDSSQHIYVKCVLEHFSSAGTHT